ncbi:MULTISPECIES: ABC transporter ATP-binding protein [unclassified Pseudomonas]|uniref:ABC transporter ATP-binding protein n=1 Tax=unclassified Pseudomonas TaxID=196821 RepID=UPI00244925B3|nr:MULTISPECIES: ABC transporter ATP-binding protein [unclassified Pseudomonas]MDH0896623.1 ABC transporter ATP-binding protein [Pseudomonas sp. GD03875]MDH1066436.1 ABC transporter ATP-binding protein [Pseudomonas sp. GD03985]
MSSEVAISLRGISKTYHVFSSPAQRLAHLLFGSRRRMGREFHALQGIDFDVRKGETLGVIGRNGAGKSTLLQIICGTLTPTTGQVRVNGRIAALLELGAGFSPEFTGRENVYMSAAIHGLGRAEIDARMADILAFAEIGDFIDQPVKTYSSGMFVRLAFAVIAHLDADILVIDEALAVGDVYFTQKCLRFLRRFAEKGTLLFVSHDTHSVINLCERALWLDGGRMQRFGEAKTVSDAYLGSFYEDRLAEQTESSAELVPVSDKEFGLGGGRIEKCSLFDAAGNKVTVLERAQRVRLEIECSARDEILSPILGFFVKDRLSQAICGENSIALLPEWKRFSAGSRCNVAFEFYLPLLATGDYTISVALGAGTQQQHVQHHWIHDALAFRSQASPSLTGLFELEGVACSVGRAAD